MVILMVNATYGLGSTGRNCQEILEELDRLGEEGHIAFSTGNMPSKGYRIGSALGKKIHAFLSRALGLQAYFSVWGTRGLLRYMEKIKPDVVHINNLHANYINLKMFLGYIQKNRIPILINLHDCWLYTGKCCHYTEIGCEKWKTGCYECPKLKEENNSWFFDRTSKMWRDKNRLFGGLENAYVVGVSDWITRQAKESILKSVKEITRIYNWVDFDSIPDMNQKECKEMNGYGGQFIVLGVATTWDDSKGLGRFRELADRLGEGCRIILVGGHNVKKSNHSKIVIKSSIENRRELMCYYIMADVFITMSYEESFGKVSSEALACGTPVICFDSTANAEVVGEGCGYVIRKGDIEGMVEAVNDVRKKGKCYYSQRCKEYAKSNFSRRDNVKRYIDLYKRMIEG